MLDEASHIIVQLPGDLYGPRPIVQIRNGRIPAFGQSRSLRVKNQIHAEPILMKFVVETNLQKNSHDSQSKNNLLFLFNSLTIHLPLHL